MNRLLLLATNNQDKIEEYRRLLAGLPYRLVSPAEQGVLLQVEESGSSLEENARLKADAFARESGLISLADDSGLEVNALGGEPGPRSARYAGENASNEERINLLLANLMGIPCERRTARFHAFIAIAVPGRDVIICEGECEGCITFEPRGDYGFGYDPVFYLPQLDKTMAELTMEEKNRISHRGKAAGKARAILERLAEENG